MKPDADYAAAIVLTFFVVLYLTLQLIAIPLIRYFRKHYLSTKVMFTNSTLVYIQFALLLVMIVVLVNEPLTFTYSLNWHESSSQGPTYLNIFYIGITLLHLLLFSITYFYSIHDLKVRKYSKYSIYGSIAIFISAFAYYQYYMACIYIDTSGG